MFARTSPLAVFVSLLATLSALQGADPPALVSYQGVLRDAADRPVDGAVDMTFRLYSAGADPAG